MYVGVEKVDMYGSLNMLISLDYTRTYISIIVLA